MSVHISVTSAVKIRLFLLPKVQAQPIPLLSIPLLKPKPHKLHGLIDKPQSTTVNNGKPPSTSH